MYRPARWDEWISFYSDRISPFRSRTAQRLACRSCPTPNIAVAHAPITGVDDVRTILAETSQAVQHCAPFLAELAQLSEQSLHLDPLTVNEESRFAPNMPWDNYLPRNENSRSHGDDERLSAEGDVDQRLKAYARDICPMLDRLGRVLTDVSQHLWEFADPGARAAQLSATPRSFDSLQSLEARLLSLFRAR